MLKKIILTNLILLVIIHIALSGWAEENKCEKYGFKHNWKIIDTWPYWKGTYYNDPNHCFEKYERCINCGKYKLTIIRRFYKYWEDKDETTQSLSAFITNYDNISFSDSDL